MARCAIVYGTKEGHTSVVAERLATELRSAGLDAHVLVASDLPNGFAIEEYGGVLIASPVHQGEYVPAVLEFARTHREWLASHASALVSVSLSAIGAVADPEDRENLAACVDRFAERTGWEPARVEHVAGALVFSQYPFFVRQVMKLIARQHDLPRSGDHDYTDYERLGAFAREFAASLAAIKV